MEHPRHSSDPRYGAWKFVHEIELEDMLEHPVWLWCAQLTIDGEEDAPMGGNGTSMRPLLESDEVPLDQIAPPRILLRVEETDYYASGLYDAKKKALQAIRVYPGEYDEGSTPALLEPLIYIAVPSIGGRRDVRFKSLGGKSGEAVQENGPVEVRL